MNFLLWFIAIFAAIYGGGLLVMPKSKLMPTIKKQLASKGNNEPSEEELDKKLKFFRMMGIVCLIGCAAMLGIIFTGGI